MEPKPIALSSTPALINENSSYINTLKTAGYVMQEVQKEHVPLNAIIYRKENTQEGAHNENPTNLMWIPGVQGEAGGTSHISAAFLETMGDSVDTVVGYNSALSRTALDADKFTADLQNHAQQMVDLYELGIPPDQKDRPITIVGHSMGGTTAPLVAQMLFERGYNVKNIIMIAPPGMDERSGIKLTKNFAELGLPIRYHFDIPALYPSPLDISRFETRQAELTNAQKKRLLTREESEELSFYALSSERFKTPDPSLLSNLSQQEKQTIQQIDIEMKNLLEQNTLSSTEITKRDRALNSLEKKRLKLLTPKTIAVSAGIINSESLQATLDKGQARAILRNIASSSKSIKNIVSTLSRMVTVDAVQNLIDYTNAHPEKSIDIALIGGNQDPITGSYDIGGVNKWNVGKKATYSEVALTNFDHFTLPDDPVRVAQIIKRILA